MNNTEGIDLILGPMKAGKSTELLRRINRYLISGTSVALIKFRKDTRYSEDHVVTHDDVVSLIEAIPVENLMDSWERIDDEVRVIGIDEGQFFPDLKDFCREAIKRRKKVIIAALNGKSDLTPWSSVSDIIPFSNISNVTAVCDWRGC